MAVIYSIVYKPQVEAERERPGDYQRVPLQQADLIAGRGIRGDQKGGHHPDRQLNLLSREWLERAQAQGYRADPGQFGEQIIIEGIAMESLAPGTRLQLGEQACIEVVKTRTGCNRLEAAQGKSIERLGPLGVMARVIKGGKIKVGDPVTVLETVQT